MFYNYVITATILFFLFSNSIVWAIIPRPYRIGGTVIVNDEQVTRYTDANYTFTITRQDGTFFLSEKGEQEAVDKDGLNDYDWYVIDIPIYEKDDQTYGAKPGDIVKIDVYKNGTKLLVTSPAGGYFIVKEEGSVDQINISAITGPINCEDCSEKIEQAVIDERARWDANNDNKIGLEEAIRSLQIVSGIIK